MQPYQQATEEIQRQQEAPIKIAKNIGGLVLGTAGGSAAINKIAPFLSKYIPENLAIQGLSKINPKMAGFISSSLAQGFSFEDIKDFLGNKIEEENFNEASKQDRNIIQQYSPELHDFISEKVRSGISPVQAGAIAQQDKRFSGIIKKMSKDHKTPWSNILESVFGQETSRRDTLKKFNEKIRKPGVTDQETERFENYYGQQQQGQGQGQAALMDVLQKLLQARGG